MSFTMEPNYFSPHFLNFFFNEGVKRSLTNNCYYTRSVNVLILLDSIIINIIVINSLLLFSQN